MDELLEYDLSIINKAEFIDWTLIDNHSFLITGATGLIGKLIVKALQYRNYNYNSKIQITLIVRDYKKALGLFGKDKNINYIIAPIEKFDDTLKLNIDYIIHGASPTSSNFFVEHPVETLTTQFVGTQKILNFANINKCKSIVFLSSMEMYGILEQNGITENVLGYIDVLNSRSSYSEGKRACELLCYSYMNEYGVPVKISRLAQSFGMGINSNESRVFKQFCNSIINEEDIILKSTGETIINFSYTTDSITAILKILLNGVNGEAYNVVNDDNSITIKEIANWLIKTKNKKSKVVFDIDEKTAYAPVNKMKLSNLKLKKLGWFPMFSIYDGYDRLLEYMQFNLKKSI